MILSLTTGIRTEEARALRWDHVDLDGDPALLAADASQGYLGPMASVMAAIQ